MSRAAIWFFAAVVGIALAASPALFNELASESPSPELQALQASEAQTARREAAGQALCEKERGPNTEARWTEDGDLVCRVRNGFKRASL